MCVSKKSGVLTLGLYCTVVSIACFQMAKWCHSTLSFWLFHADCNLVSCFSLYCHAIGEGRTKQCCICNVEEEEEEEEEEEKEEESDWQAGLPPWVQAEARTLSPTHVAGLPLLWLACRLHLQQHPHCMSKYKNSLKPISSSSIILAFIYSIAFQQIILFPFFLTTSNNALAFLSSWPM